MMFIQRELSLHLQYRQLTLSLPHGPNTGDCTQQVTLTTGGNVLVPTARGNGGTGAGLAPPCLGGREGVACERLQICVPVCVCVCMGTEWRRWGKERPGRGDRREKRRREWEEGRRTRWHYNRPYFKQRLATLCSQSHSVCPSKCV